MMWIRKSRLPALNLVFNVCRVAYQPNEIKQPRRSNTVGISIEQERERVEEVKAVAKTEPAASCNILF